MDQEIYDQNGCCLRCKGTNICHSCNGSGKKIFKKDSSFLKDTEVPCPTCYGGGDCKFCRNRKRASVIMLNPVKYNWG